MNPKNTVDKWNAVKSSFKTLKDAGLNVFMLKNDEAYDHIVSSLGKKVLAFDPSVEKKYGELKKREKSK
jgi:hypothetical protein